MKISISHGLPATFDKAGFEALDWGESIEIVGDIKKVDEFTPVKSELIVKHKGWVSGEDKSLWISQRK